MTQLRIGERTYPLVSPLPEIGERILLDEYLPAEQMGVYHPHAGEWLIVLVTSVTDDENAGVSVIDLTIPQANQLVAEITAAYSAQLEQEIAL